MCRSISGVGSGCEGRCRGAQRRGCRAEEVARAAGRQQVGRVGRAALELADQEGAGEAADLPRQVSLERRDLEAVRLAHLADALRELLRALGHDAGLYGMASERVLT